MKREDSAGPQDPRACPQEISGLGRWALRPVHSRGAQMARRLVNFFRLSFSDQGLLIQAALAVVNAKLAVRTLPLSTARSIVTRQQRLGRMALPVRPDRIVWAVEGASRVIPGMKNCLVQAVAAEAMLIQAGHPCDLRTGAAKNRG
jgi:hypothetical protein